LGKISQTKWSETQFNLKDSECLTLYGGCLFSCCLTHQSIGDHYL